MKTLFAFLIGLCLFNNLLSAQTPNAAELRARMEKRIAVIDQMKLKGALGENSRGLLEARAAGADSALIVAENADRSAVYALLARQTGAKADDVAKARARKIAELSPAGVWIQKDDGTWYRK